MKDVKRCKRCILPENFPNIVFDENGICNYCHEWDKKWKNFDYNIAKNELIELFKKVKKLDRKYDCMVPFSGGRDSSYVLYLVKEKYGLNPLAVTFNNGFMSHYALENILNLTKLLKVDHVIHGYSWDQLQKMYKTTIKKSGEFCSICSTGINYVQIVYQEKFKIPLIISGTSTRVDEQSPFEIISSHPQYVRNVLKDDFPNKNLDDFILPRRNNWSAFKMVINKLKGADYIRINLPDYIPWKVEEIQDILVNDLGWKTPDKNKDHIDCKYAEMKTYLKNKQIPGNIFKQEKYSQMIRDGQLTRQEAMNRLANIVNKQGKPEVYDEFIKEFELEEKEIEKNNRKSHLNFISKDETVEKEEIIFKLISIPWKFYKTIKS